MSKKRKNIKLFLDRAMSRSFGRQIVMLLILFVVLLAISFLLLSISGADWRAFCQRQGLAPWLLPVYLLIDTNAFNNLYLGGDVHGWMLAACSITYLCGLIVFNGIIIGLITNAIDHRVEAHRNGLLHYVESGHYIIMGYDDMVPSIITEIFAKTPDADVVLLTALDAKQVNEKLLRSVARDKMDQIFIAYGHRMVKEYYKDIHLETAKVIYIVGNRTRPAHDAVNVECVDSIYAYLTEHDFAQKPKRIICVFEDFDTYSAFKTTEIFSQIGRLGIEFVPYNFYDDWANQVFVYRSYKEKNNLDVSIPYPSVFGKGVSYDDEKQVHLVFVGASNFSLSFAMQAAHLLHFPNFQRNKTLRTRITFIDKNADEELQIFATRNRHFFEVQPYLYCDMSGKDAEYQAEKVCELVSKDFPDTDFLDVEFEFIKGNAYSAEMQNLIKRWAEDAEHQYLSLFIAMADQRKNFMMGMNMPDEVYDYAVPVFIRQDRADDFVTNLRAADDKEYDYYKVSGDKLMVEKRKHRYANIYPFGMDDMAYRSDETFLRQAKLLNYLYSTADYATLHYTSLDKLAAMPENDIWNEAEKFWRSLTVAKKWSNLYCAHNISCKVATLRALRNLEPDDSSQDLRPLNDEEVELMAFVEHNRWNTEKLLMGFRKPKRCEDRYESEQFDQELKRNKDLYIHYDILPFEKLTAASQQLDREIVKYIPWLLQMTAYKHLK
ncbi:MAG: hypothetical protein J6T59_04400 [Bacteroidales bacterium]|nr:hypothetical protein [Bacteroidales bacterium]